MFRLEGVHSAANAVVGLWLYNSYVVCVCVCVCACQVDKYIRKLDAELSRFEQELQLKDSLARRTSLSSLSDMQAAIKPSESN